MQRIYNTIKNEYFNLYSFRSSDELDEGIYEFVNVKYNYVRPQFYYGGLSPYAVHCAV